MSKKQETQKVQKSLKPNALYLDGFQPPFLNLNTFEAELDLKKPSKAEKILGSSRKPMESTSSENGMGEETKKGSGLYHPQKRAFEGVRKNGD